MSEQRGEQGHDPGHRRARRRLEGRGLVRAERPPGRLGRRPATGSSRSPTSSAGIPNRAARALSAARADACGLVLARPARTLALEPFFMEFIAGVEVELSSRSVALTLQLVEDIRQEIAVYRRWFGEHRVDGVLMVDLRVHDLRVEELVRLGLPAVVVGGPLENRALPAVFHDEAIVVIEAVQYLAALGHTQVAHVTGVSDFVHTRQRTAGVRARHERSSGSRRTSSRPTTAPSGARATRKLLSSPDPPTAIVFDSDLLAVTGLGVAQQMGFPVPDDVSIVGWDDSLISQVVHPPLTAITRDITGFGATPHGTSSRRSTERRAATSRRRAASSRFAAAPAAAPPGQRCVVSDCHFPVDT